MSKFILVDLNDRRFGKCQVLHYYIYRITRNGKTETVKSKKMINYKNFYASARERGEKVSIELIDSFYWEE